MENTKERVIFEVKSKTETGFEAINHFTSNEFHLIKTLLNDGHQIISLNKVMKDAHWCKVNLGI